MTLVEKLVASPLTTESSQMQLDCRQVDQMKAFAIRIEKENIRTLSTRLSHRKIDQTRIFELIDQVIISFLVVKRDGHHSSLSPVPKVSPCLTTRCFYTFNP
jgi:hypothetical protein